MVTCLGVEPRTYW